MIAALRADVQPAFRFLAEDGGLALGAANPQPLRHSPFASSHSRRHASWPLRQGLQDILFAHHGLHFKPVNLQKPASPPKHEFRYYLTPSERQRQEVLSSIWSNAGNGVPSRYSRKA